MEYDKVKRKEPSLLPEPVEKSNCKIVALLSSGVVCIIIAVLLVHINIVQIIANFRTKIANGTEIYQLLEHVTEGLHVSAYLFNVTNAEEFLRGEDHKLRVEEVGPFTYKELRSNLDMEVDEEAQVLRYTPKTDPVFVPEQSIADPKDVIVTMPNIAMLAMSSMISSHGFLAKTGFSLLLQHLGSKAIVNLTAHDFLWGYDEPLIRLGNQVLPGWISFETLGILDRLYDNSLEYRLEVSTILGEKFKVKNMNGLGGLKYWGYEDPEQRTTCNTFTDAFEGIAYPNHLAPGTPLKLYRNVLCRQMELTYVDRVTTPLGADALHYRISDSAYDITNDTECLCMRGTCARGVSDLSPCYYGLPLALSNAHFLNGDPQLLERVEGLNPNQEKHGSDILIEPILGMVLKTEFTVQVNVAVKQINFNEQAGRFSDMMVPVSYLKLTQPDLIEYNIKNLKLMYILAPTLIITFVILFSIAGISLIIFSSYLFLLRLAHTKGNKFTISSNEGSPGTNVPLLGIQYLYNRIKIQ